MISWREKNQIHSEIICNFIVFNRAACITFFFEGQKIACKLFIYVGHTYQTIEYLIAEQFDLNANYVPKESFDYHFCRQIATERS